MASRRTFPSFKLLMFCLILLASCATATIDFNNLTGGCNDATGIDCGHGTCVDSVCICEPLWSTLSDFVNIQECVTSLIGMYVLWAMNVAVVIFVYFKSSAIILLRFEVFFETKRTRKGYTLWDNKGLLAVLCMFVLSSPAQLIMSILHFVDPTSRIGFDAFPTILFFIAKFGFYTAIFFVQSSMFSHVMKGIRGVRKLVPLNTAFQGFLWGVSTINGGIAFITLVNFQNDIGAQVQIMRAYYAIQTLSLFINSFGAFVLIRLVKSTFSAVKDVSVKSQEVQKKVNELQIEAMRQAGFQSIIYVLLAAIPFFVNKHQYFLPMSWLAMPILGMKLALQFSSDRGAKTIMQRLGIRKTGNSSDIGDNTSRSGTGNKNAAHNTTETGAVDNKTTLLSSSPPEHGSFHVVSPMQIRRKKNAEGNPGSDALSSGTYLDELMDPAHPLHDRFVEFVNSRHAANEVALFKATLEYQNASTLKERTKLGKAIVKDFIEENAERGVDIPADTKTILLSTAKRSQWTPTTLDAIRQILFFEIKGNFLSKFEDHLEKDHIPDDPKV